MEVKLTDKQLREIAELAHRNFVGDSVRPTKHQLFLCECYVKAIVSFLTANKMNVRQGKIIYEYDDNETE